MPTTDRPPVLMVTRCFIKRDEQLLILKRAADDVHNAGLWEAPGGKLERGQTLNRGLEDEILQETGFLIHPTAHFVYSDSNVIGDGKYAGFTYVVLFSVARILSGELRLSCEHDDHAWATYSQVLERELTYETRRAAMMMESMLRDETAPLKTELATA